MPKDIQRNRWMLTINNPQEYALSHFDIKKNVIDNFPTIDYFAMVDEQGSTYHTHVFLYFKSRVRFSKLKKYFPSAHIDAVKGTTSECISYLKKDGKWIDDDTKQEQKIEGTFEDWGKLPPEKGTRSQLADLYEMIKLGYSNAEIIADNPDLIPQLNNIDRVRTTILIEKYKNQRRMDLKVTYISGATGSGKTRSVLDKHGDANVFKVNHYQHPFDNYNAQPVLLFDEFRNGLPLSDMLGYCDIYPIELPARYANRYACYEHVYIVSNWDLEMQYREAQSEDVESWQAFLRRIHEVQVFAQDGSVTVYPSVEKYLNRFRKYEEVEEEEDKQQMQQMELAAKMQPENKES